MAEAEIVRKTFTDAKSCGFEVAYARIEGNKPGRTLAVVAGQHGMEHIGPMAMTQLIDEMREEDALVGTLLLCPCANPKALELDYEFYPENEDLSKISQYFYSRFRHSYCVFGQGRKDDGLNYCNMNRLWARDDVRGVAGRITQWLWDEICVCADAVIDMHCLQAKRPLIYNCDEASNAIARLFGIQAVYMTRKEGRDDFNQGQLGYRVVSEFDDKMSLTVEFSRQHEVRDWEIPLAKQGVRNVMRGMGMLPGQVVLDRPVYRVKQQTGLSTEAAGHIHFEAGEHDPVKAGQTVFEIRSVGTLEVLDTVASPVDGIMLRHTHLPVSRPGENVCTVATVDVLAEAGVPLPRVFE